MGSTCSNASAESFRNCDPSGIRTLYPGIMETSIAARPCADLRLILRSSDTRGGPCRTAAALQVPCRRGKGVAKSQPDRATSEPDGRQSR